MKLVLNFIVFQAAWFSCVLGAANGLPWAGPLAVLAAVMLHLRLSRQPSLEIRLILAAVALGLLADAALLATGWVAFPNGAWLPGAAPYWMAAMWALFATTLNVSMRWLRSRLWLAMAAGAIGGPLSYWAGERLGAMSFVEPVPALLAIAAAWVVAMPLLTLLSCRFDGVEPPARRPDYITDDWKAARHA
jgi:hypothetical protein